MSERKSNKRGNSSNKKGNEKEEENGKLAKQDKRRKVENSAANRGDGKNRIARQRLPQQERQMQESSVSDANGNFNENRSSNDSTSAMSNFLIPNEMSEKQIDKRISDFSKVKSKSVGGENPKGQSSANSKTCTQFKNGGGARRSLIQEMDEIDAEFQEAANARVINAPDGIRITVNRDEENEFVEHLDYDDLEESIFPIGQEIDSDADTEFGEDGYLNNSQSSSTIISFKRGTGQVVNESNLCFPDKPVVKRVEDMTPDELVEANPALKKWMEEMVKKRQTPAKAGPAKRTQGKGKRTNGGGSAGANFLIKSPSDTTIYAPALKLTPDRTGLTNPVLAKDDIAPILPVINNDQQLLSQQEQINEVGAAGDVNSQISEFELNSMVSQFIDQVRREMNKGRCVSGRQNNNNNPQPSTSREPQPGTSRAVQLEEANRVSQDMIVQAEKHRMNTELPQGGLFDCNGFVQPNDA